MCQRTMHDSAFITRPATPSAVQMRRLEVATRNPWRHSECDSFADCKVQADTVAAREATLAPRPESAALTRVSSVARPVLIPGMMLGVILGSVLVAMTAYGLWMAARLGVGPRRRR